MANPTLDDSQKYRTTKRLMADHDVDIAVHDSYTITKRIADVAHRAQKCKGEANRSQYNKMIEDLKQEESIIKRNVTKYRWQACKLHLSAPLDEVTLSERGVRIFGHIKHEVLLHVGRFLTRWPVIIIDCICVW